MKIQPSGPSPARVLIVGEAPGADEEARGVPFVGPSGYLLSQMLSEAGIDRATCRITNVTNERPPYNDIGKFFPKTKKEGIPLGGSYVRNRACSREIKEGVEELKAEILRTRPNIILACGGTSLWALSGHDSILKWRGSQLHEDLTGQQFQVIPTLHPAAVLRDFRQKSITVHDFRRASQYQSGRKFAKPEWKFLVRPSLSDVLETVWELREKLRRDGGLTLSLDIETRLGHTSCIGVAWSKTEALCIPLMARGFPDGYWSLDEEALIQHELHLLLKDPLVQVIGQNLLYDAQYFWRWLKYVPRITFDTMIGQHALFSDLPKSLGFIASLYCESYTYWKDEGKNWDEKGDETVLWEYNCRDCCYTYEVYESLVNLTKQMGRSSVQAAQQDLFWPVLSAMLSGVLIDLEARERLRKDLAAAIEGRRSLLEAILGHSFNPNSPKQMKALFYDDLKLPVQQTRAKKGQPGRPTLNDEALQALAKIEPLVAPIINCIGDLRTLRIFQSTFVEAALDTDYRMRSSFNIGGSESGKTAPKTYRISSSQNAFGTGANLQTIPSAKSKSVGKAAARAKAGGLAGLGDPLSLPDLRSIFVPDPSRTFFNGDLDRADLQVVAWEAQDELLKSALKLGADIHLLNAFALEGKEPPPLEELVKTHPRYETHYGPRKHLREFAKVFCHATNYVGSPRTIAAHTGRLVREIERAQANWFGQHPGIKQWHNRVQHDISKWRFVENRFGYRWHIFDRIDNILPEAVAWIPQSTVSNVINKIWQAYYNEIPEVEVLLQVHDSLAGQFPTDQRDYYLARMADLSAIVVPYDDPLIIPFSIGTSQKSWADCG
jgi:DNA polymerase I-like protein with 3'-5' exonuclease and polymerase domains/uracil-DNA glycosylase